MDILKKLSVSVTGCRVILNHLSPVLLQLFVNFRMHVVHLIKMVFHLLHNAMLLKYDFRPVDLVPLQDLKHLVIQSALVDFGVGSQSEVGVFGRYRAHLYSFALFRVFVDLSDVEWLVYYMVNPSLDLGSC